MLIILIILTVIIVIVNIFILKSLSRIKTDKSKISEGLKISVIIAFKNEEKNLPNLLKCFHSINYQPKNFEIIFVDDNSDDKSEEVIKSNSLINSKLIKAIDKKIAGKKGALEIGIQQANYDIIAITDADCIVEKDWLKSISNKISQGYDLVFGYSPLFKGKSLIGKISAYENLKNYILYFSSVELGFPFGATARSLAFKKSVYFTVNGYINTTETLSGDDDLFIRECLKKNFRIGYFLDENSFVYSYPSESFKEYFLRKSRHLKTSHHYSFKNQVILGTWYSANLLATLSVTLALMSFNFVIPFIVKILFDFVIVTIIKKKFKHDFNVFNIIYCEIFYQFLLAINFFGSLIIEERWD
jgi:glycosyltransferase involved in cell wall biosynthesis